MSADKKVLLDKKAVVDKVNQLREQALGRLNPKHRQWVVLGAIGGGIGGVMWVLSAITDKGPSRPAPTPGDPLGIFAKGEPNRILASGSQVRTADVWMANANKDVDQLKRDREDARRKIESQDKASKEMLARFDELQKKLSQQQLAASLPPVAASAPKAPERVTESAPRQSLPPLPPPPKPVNSAGMAPLPFGEPGMSGFGASPSASLVRVSLSDPSAALPTTAAGVAAAQASKAEAAANPVGKGRSLDTFLPISFTRAVLLGGLDAPTGGQSQSNPHPVLLRLEDNAILPNRFRAQVRECFVVGAAYGDLSSERAYIRTERLSCVRNDGTAIEIQIKGSVFGEDGKNGVRGRLVSKQGMVLANALVAGVIGGIGAGVQSQFTSTSNSPLGSVTSTESGKAFESGVGQGFGKAMDRLASYYITLAEKMFPIIEIDAGRLVDVVLTEGATLEAPLSSDAPAAATRSSLRAQNVRIRTTEASNDD